jgi:hypothetical protein
MRKARLLALAALLLAGATARASDPIGILARIDKVVLEPKDGTPERVRLYGVFILQSNRGRERSSPTRGYLYFTTVQGKEDQCRHEWADLKKIAGKDQPVAFGNSFLAPATIRKPRLKVEPAAPLEAAKLNGLIGQLSSDDFAVREKATKTLAEQGEHAYPALQKALEGKTTPESRRRIERLLVTETPEAYPLGFGLTKLEGDYGKHMQNVFGALPGPVSPAESATVEPGTVTLKTKNVTCTDHPKAGYVFEIMDASGDREESQVVAGGDKETTWSPRMEIKPGKKYIWRVHAVEGKWQGPSAETSFQGKQVQAGAADSAGIAWFQDPVCQMVFFAVLEGLYTDGVSNETVDLIIPDGKFHEHFVDCCPLCQPAFEAIRLYRSRQEFIGFQRPPDTFGKGLDAKVVATLRSAKKTERLEAIQGLVNTWTGRRLESMRLSKEERADWSRRLEERRKQGMAQLQRCQAQGQGYAGWKSCAICDGSAAAFSQPK